MLHEEKFKSSKHPLSLRIYWIVNFVIASLFAISAVFRIVNTSEEKMELSLRIDDIFSLVNLPLSAFFFVISIRGSSGILVIRISDVVATYTSVPTDGNLSPYAGSSFLSKTVWFWMNPLINNGYKTPLKLEDIPSLPLEFRAEKMSENFINNWPKPEENSKHPVMVALFRCFWKHIAITGFLAVIRLCVMYIGPLLIQSFVDFTSRKDSTTSEDIILILILFAAKSVEVLSVINTTSTRRKSVCLFVRA
ncbi:putative xenobiotic-transporting ATPase [Medicago truncatula]|nr:putative xenobiotic-transporting ATPase [Medicago truncatula]